MHNRRPRKNLNRKVRYRIVEKTFSAGVRFILELAEYFDGVYRFQQSYTSREDARKDGEWYAQTHEVTS